jgi:hypothetical protein
MKQSMFILLVLVLSSCKIFHHSNKNAHPEKLANDVLTLEIECIDNAMPMTSSKPYLIITACSNDTLNENYKIIELVATGSNSSWKTQSFDFNEYLGKGYDQYHNVARNFDLTIGAPINFLVTLQTESGITTSYEVKLGKIQVVY